MSKAELSPHTFALILWCFTIYFASTVSPQALQTDQKLELQRGSLKFPLIEETH